MEREAYLELAATEESHWWYLGRRAVLTSILSRMDLPPNARILEIGCGTGGNLEMLAAFGKVRGMEMDAAARELAAQKSQNRVEIRAGACPNDIPFAGEQFDLICLFDVLEHIAEDEETLSALHGLLAPGGKLLITVPAYPWLWSAHDVFYHHKRRYTRKELIAKARDAGLSIRRASHFNACLLPLAVAGRLKDRIFRTSTTCGTKMLPAPVNFAFGTIFGAERFLLRGCNLPFGLSLLAILERPVTHAVKNGAA